MIQLLYCIKYDIEITVSVELRQNLLVIAHPVNTTCMHLILSRSTSEQHSFELIEFAVCCSLHHSLQLPCTGKQFNPVLY